MKRVLTVSVFALAVVMLSQQQAMAWSKFGFNIGMNVNYECADNVFLWGACRSGPVPGSYGHGMASTMTHGETAYTGSPGFGYAHGHYDPGFGNWSAPGTGGFSYGLNATAPPPVHGGGSGFGGTPGTVPYAPASVPATLPAPAQSAPLAPINYWTQPYYWTGN